MSTSGCRFFHAIASALAFSEIYIENLTLGSDYLDVPPLLSMIQSLTPIGRQLYQMTFRNLKHLHLKVSWSGSDYEDVNFDGLSMLIQSAQRLEGLSLNLWPFTPTLPSSFLRSFEIPRLHTLKLWYATFQDPFELIHFLSKHALTLRAIEFCGLGLKKGS